MFQFFSNLALRYKMFTIIILNVLTISLCSIAGYFFCISSYNEILFEYISANMSFSTTTVKADLNRIETVSSLISYSDIIQDDLTAISDTPENEKNYILSETRSEINNLLFNYYTEYNSYGISYIALYNAYDYDCTNSFRLNNHNPALVKTALEEAARQGGSSCWNYSANDNTIILSRLIRKSKNLDFTPIGYFLIAVNIDDLINKCNRLLNQYNNTQYILTDNNNNIICHSPLISNNDALYFKDNAKPPYNIIKHKDNIYFSTITTIPELDFTYTTLISYNQINNRLKTIFVSIVLFVVVGIIIVIIITNIIMNKVLEQFNTLINKMKTFSYGNIEHSNPDITYTNDEIGQLHRQFDDMSEKISSLINTNYINKILARDAQIKALEAQINPHFLYNTLESINWRAKAVGDTNISLMVESLGTLLRATLSSKKSYVTINYELSLVRSFLTIEKLRYEERLEYEINVPDELLSAIIPPLTIQPLLENAIKYGLEEMIDTCHIYVIIEKSDDDILIYVKNEGSYFEENILDKLKFNEKKPHGTGIGLLNINSRIQLLYGDSYGISFLNENDFAIAIIRIPYKTEESITENN